MRTGEVAEAFIREQMVEHFGQPQRLVVDHWGGTLSIEMEWARKMSSHAEIIKVKFHYNWEDSDVRGDIEVEDRRGAEDFHFTLPPTKDTPPVWAEKRGAKREVWQIFVWGLDRILSELKE